MSERFLLDTDIVVDALRDRRGVRARLQQVSPDDIGIASMTAAELAYGASNAARPAEMLAELDRFLDEIRVVPFGPRAARRHGELRLAMRAHLVGPEDLVIAATALTAGATLVTGNVREFSRVPGLVVANWRS